MANTVFKLRRSSVAGKVPNTSTLSIGELGLNLTDKILYSSDGSSVFEVGANNSSYTTNGDITLATNNKRLSFRPLAGGNNVYFTQQTDDNFVFYSTDTSNNPRAVWSIFANSVTSNLNLSVPVNFNSNIGLATSVAIYANGSPGSAAQVLSSNGSSTYWATLTALATNTAAQYTWTNTHTFQANVSFTGSGLAVNSNTGSVYFGGISDANWRISRNAGVTTKYFYTNNTLDIIAASSPKEGIVFGWTGNSYLEIGYAGTYTTLPIYVGNSSVNTTINATSFTGTSNNSLYLGGTAAASYVQNTDSRTLSGNLTYTGANLVILGTNTYITSNVLINGVASFKSVSGQSNASGGNFISNAYATLGGAGGNYLAFGQQTNFSQWIQSGYPGASPVYYDIILNPLGGNTGIGNTLPNHKLSVNGSTYFQGQVTFTQGITDSTGVQGNPGSILTSNGSGNVYWSSTANNATNLNAQPASYYTNATNINTGTLPYAQLGNNVVNTTSAFTFSGVHTHSANVVLGSSGLSANGSYGSAGQSLLSNGSATYWSTAGATLNANNTDTQTFYIGLSNASSGAWTNAVVSTTKLTYVPSTGTLTSTAFSGNGSAVTSVDAATVGGNTASTLRTYTDDRVANAYSNSVSYTDSKILTANGAITGNAATAYSNATSYTDSKIATANAAITGNAATAYSNAVSYTDGKILTANAAITGNAATAYTNAVSYTDGKILTANAAITGNAATAYSNAIAFASNASNINTGTLAEARLPYRMNQNLTSSNNVTFGSLTLTGNLTVSGNVTVIGANALSIVDNMIYLNSNNTTQNIDVGMVANYNSGAYAHTGIFRDASDGYWKVFDNYLPEPDANVNIDTTNTSFHLADFQANSFYAGNTSTNWLVVNTAGTYHTGTINAASHTVGTSFTANSTLTNTVSLVVSTNTATIGTGTYFVSNGNVGIGNSTPADKLSIGGTTYFKSGGAAIVLDSGSATDSRMEFKYNGTRSGYISVDTGSFTVAANASANLIFQANATEYMRITSGGNVGVGLSNPSNKLTINGGLLVAAQGNVSVQGAHIMWNKSSGTGATYIINQKGGGAGGIYFGESNTSDAFTENMRIDASGNVGIGNTAPANKLSVNGTTYLGGAVSSAINLTVNTAGVYHTGVVNAATLSTGSVNVVNTSGLKTSANVNIAATGELILTSGAGIYANGGLGSAGEVLHSNGSSVYWATDDQGVTSVATGSGLTGGTITSTGTVSVLANNGITANTTGLFVTQGTGTVVNATGVHVNSTYIGTLSANNTTYVNGKTEGNLNVNSAVTVTTNTSTNTFTIGTASYFVANGNFGIGTTTPAYKLQVNGSFAAVTKSFLIDHPSKPGMKLRHGSLEGPENGVYVRGRTKGNYIELPDYWSNLVDVDSITVQLTPIGKSKMPSVGEITIDKIEILGKNVDCFYHVYAERKDVDKLIVEF